MATGVEVHCIRGTVQVRARSSRDVLLLKKGETKTVAIHKDRPVIVNVHKDARATAKSTTGIMLICEFEDEDGFIQEIKLKPPLKQALREGHWVIMAPNAA